MTQGSSIQVTAVEPGGGAPIEEAAVFLADWATGEPAALGATDAAGQTVLTDLSAGSYLLRTSIPDRWVATDVITLGVNEVVQRSYELYSAGLVTGTVTGAGGAPLANVPVQASHTDGSLYLAFTDETGTYALEELPPGSYAVSLWGGRDRVDLEVMTSTWQHVAPFAPTGVIVEGRVVGSGGGPLTDVAAVVLFKDGQAVHSATTDENDNYRFVAVTPGVYELAAANPAGITPFQGVTVAGVDLLVPDLWLGGHSYGGSVADGGGASLAEAVVSLIPLNLTAEELTGYLYRQTATDGLFQFDGLTEGQYTLRVARPGYAIHRQTVTVGPGGRSRQDVTLGPGQTISGLVRSIASGQPVGGAFVIAYDAAAGDLMGIVASDPLGAYVLADLPDGTYDLVAVHAGYRQAIAAGLVVQGGSLVRDLNLAPANTGLEGTVRDDVGRPISGALVWAADSRGREIASRFTDHDGGYHFDELPAGTYTVLARAAGFIPTQAAGIYLADGTTVGGIDLTLLPGGLGVQPQLAGILNGMPDAQEVESLFWANVAYQVYSYLKSQVIEPQREPGDMPGGPPVPQPECPEARDAFFRALDALSYKESAWDRWLANYRNYDRALGSAAWTFGWEAADLAASIAGLQAQAGAALMQAYPGVYAFTQAAPLLANLGGMMDGLISAVQNGNMSGQELVDFLSSTFDSFFSIQSQGIGLMNLYLALTTNQTAMGLASNIAGYVSVAAKAIKTLVHTIQSFQAIIAAADGMVQGREEYLDAWKKFQAALRALEAANDACDDDDDDKEPEDNPNPDNPVPTDEVDLDVITSGDPNDKLTVGLGSEGWVGGDASILYVIRFENVPTATAPAQQVFITDVLDADLDWSSLELVSVAFNQVYLTAPPGMDHYEGWATVTTDPNPVHVQASLDPDTGVLTWIMESVDPITGELPEDPIAGFLPPNDTENRGQGYVSFRVRPSPALTDGVPLYNQATIVFDVNEPIETNVVTNTLDSLPPISAVEPLSATSPISFTVRWSGERRGRVGDSPLSCPTSRWTTAGTPSGRRR